MTHGQDQQADAHRRDLELHQSTILWCMVYRAERAYDRTFATLVVGNAGGALATLAYATANRHDGTFTRSLLVPLVLFVVGLAITGVSSLIAFEIERRAIMRARGAASLSDLPFSGLPLDWRTATAFAAGACFVIAFAFGFAMLSQN